MLRFTLGIILGILVHLLGQEAANYSSNARHEWCIKFQKNKGLDHYPYCWRTFSNLCTPLWEKVALYSPDWWDTLLPDIVELNLSSSPSDGKCK